MHSSKLNAAETFVALDLDRTLFQTDIFAELVFKAAGATLSNAVVQEIRHNERTHRGQMYDVLGVLEGAGCSPEYIKKSILEEHADTRMLYEGVEEVLQWLDGHVGGWGIVTYGSRIGQGIKLRLAEKELGRTLPALTTNSLRKPQLVATWLVTDIFVPPLELNPERRAYNSVVIIDDKTDNMPQTELGQRGVLIDNTRHDSSAASIPTQLQQLLSVSG